MRGGLGSVMYNHGGPVSSCVDWCATAVGTVGLSLGRSVARAFAEVAGDGMPISCFSCSVVVCFCFCFWLCN